MGKRLYKTYRDLSNIVVRVSNGTDAGKAHAILVNAHLDSTLPSPGAADDALPCRVMLEAFRVMTQTPGWSPHHAIVFREWTLARMCPISAMWQEQLRGISAVVAAPIGALAGANTVAYIMTKVFNKGMSWFSVELSCLVLYLPPALAGALASQLFFGRIHEVTVFTSLLLLQSYLAFLVQMIGYGSAAMFYLSALPLGVSLLLNQMFVMDPDEIHLWTYAISQFVPLMNGTQLCVLARRIRPSHR